MSVYPQLRTGGIAQFPYLSRVRSRTLLHQPLQGREVRYSDVDFHERTWELTYENLTDEEWSALEGLFEASEGRLKGFLFLEPGANLLAWSEASEQETWLRDGSISSTDGTPDATGGGAGFRISGSGRLRQTLSVPAEFRYAGSVWAKTTSAGAGLRVGDGGSRVGEAGFASDGKWRRYSLAYPGGSTRDEISYDLFSASGSVEIYGPQLEAQPAPSAYKKTRGKGGVYPAARFDQDSLVDRLTGPGRHSGVVRISWNPSQA